MKRIAYLPIYSEFLSQDVFNSLKFAKKNSDFLVCGIISDEVLKEHDFTSSVGLDKRMEMISSLNFVDSVMIQNSRGPKENLVKIHGANPNSKIILFHNSNSGDILGSNYLSKIGGELMKIDIENEPIKKNQEKKIKKEKLLKKEKFIQAWGGQTSLQSLECHTLRYVKFKKYLSNSIIGKIYCDIKNGHHTVYFDRRDILRWNLEGKELLNPKNQKRIVNLNKIQIKKFYHFLSNNVEKDYLSMSKDQLLETYKKLIKLIMENGAFFPYSREETTKPIKEEIISRINKHKDYEKIFEILTTPTGEDIFYRELVSKIELSKKHNPSEKDYEDYIKTNAWRFINVYSKEEMIEFLKEELKEKGTKDFLEELKRRKERSNKLGSLQEIYFKEIGSKKVKNLCLFLQQIAKIRLENKKIWSGYEVWFLEMFQKIAKFADINLRDFLYTYTIKDIISFLSSGEKLSGEEIISRKSHLSILISNDKTLYLTKPIYSDLDLSIEISGDTLVGESGNLGRVVGRAKIVTQDSIDYLMKLKKEISNDEIYITTMTHPAMVSILNGVRGIVTDEGGVTSHAAIISRELNLPCLVGTRNATTFFKDGDFVELDSYTKTVKKITEKKYYDEVGGQNPNRLKKKKSEEIIKIRKRKVARIDYFFNQLKASNKKNVLGGKGHNLEICSEIYEVPKYFCLSRRLFDEIFNSYLGKKDELILEMGNSEMLHYEIEKLKEFIENYKFNGLFMRELKNKLGELKSEHLAIRSSASCEDSSSVSFAGQFKTYLGVKKEEAIEKIRECLKNSLVEGVLIYSSKMNISLEDFYMAIVIQEYVPADKAGVFFTKNPLDSSKKGFWIDANFGAGESVVSGEVKPDQYQIYNGKIRAFVSENKKSFSYVSGKKIINGVNKDRVLNDLEINSLVNLAHLVLDEYKKDVEFEWCIRENKLYLLQARPITK